MTKKDLAEYVAEKAEISEDKARAVLDSIFDSVSRSLANKNGKITLTGFGTFSTSHRKARNGRNPRTGEAIKIKAHKVIRFKPSKKLNESI